MKTTQRANPPSSLIQKTVLSLLFLTLMGWLILLCMSLWIWVTQGFEAALVWVHYVQLKTPALMPSMQHNSTSLVNDVIHHGVLFWVLICEISHVMMLKLFTLVSALPLFALAILAGLIDGLNQRAIRAACLGRESTYVFHKSVPFAHKTLCLVLGIWLCVPRILPHEVLFIGLAILLSLVTRISASRFKKYL